MSEINAEHIKQIRAWQVAVNSDPILRPVREGTTPLTVNMGAAMQNFDQESFARNISKGETYACTGTLDWVSALDSPTSGVSINTDKLKYMTE